MVKFKAAILDKRYIYASNVIFNQTVTKFFTIL